MLTVRRRPARGHRHLEPGGALRGVRARGGQRPGQHPHNILSTFCQHSVNMNNKPVCAGGAVGALPGAGGAGGGAGVRPGGAQLQLPPHLGSSRARRGAALDIYVYRGDLLYYNIWAQ